MSTYTDYKCERKENLTVLRKPGCPSDGITPQKVIFANDANIYKGTFEGKVIAKDLALSGIEITDCTINGGVLLDTSLCSDGQVIKLTDLTSDVSQIKTDLYNNLSTSLTALQLSVQESAKHLEPIIDSKISAISSTLTTMISGVSSDVISSIDATSCNLLTIINEISTEITSDISSISTEITSDIKDISIDLSNEISNRISSDDAICANVNLLSGQFLDHVEDFNDHVKDNERQFAYFENYMLSSIMHDKHYQIYESAKLTDVKPYRLHDFGINIIEDTIDDATITFDGDIIGYASRFKDSSNNDCIKISISGASKNPRLSAILPDPYNVEMLQAGKPRSIHFGSTLYTITYINTVSNPKLQIQSTLDGDYINVVDSGGNVIGYILDYEINGSFEDNTYTLVSGQLRLQNNNGNIKNFSDFINYIPIFNFTQNDRSSGVKYGYRISIQPDNRTFLFESQINTYKYTTVNADSYGTIANIYENSYITLPNSDNSISSFTVSDIKLLNDKNIGSATLNIDNNFESYASTPGYIIKYNDINKTIDISSANTQYKYEFINGDGYIIPQGLNTKLDDDPSAISVNIKIPIADFVLDPTYELVKTGDYWQYKKEVDPETGDYLDIKYSDGKIVIKGNVSNIDYSTIIDEPYEIDVNNPIPYYTNEQHLVTSDKIEFIFDKEKYTSLPENQDSAYSADDKSSTIAEDIDLTINNLDIDQQIVQFIIPEKTDKYYDCAREFIVASTIESLNDNVKIKFLEHDGSDANVIIDNGTQLSVQPANKLVILQLNEIEQNTFFARYYTNDNLNIISADVHTLTVDYSNTTNASISSLNVIDSNVVNISISNLTAINSDLSNAGISSLTATNLSNETADIVNAGISSLTATNLSNETADIVNAGISNLTATNSDLSNVGISSLTAINSDLSNAGISNLTATNLSNENADIVNAGVSNLTATNLSNETADIVNAGISSLTATNLDLSNVGISNLTVINSDLSNAGISNLTATNLSAEKLLIDLSNLINKNSETSSKYPNINLFIQSVDLSVDAISSNLADIWKNMRGGLNYKDNLCIDINYADDDEKITTISGLIYENIKIKTGKSDEDIKSIRLREGFFFILESEEKTYRRVLDGHELEYGDWLIIKNNSILSNLTSSNVRIFDAQDYDSFRLSSDNIISGNNLFYGSLSSVGTTYISALTAISTTITDAILTNANISNLTATNLSNETADIVNAGISSLTATNLDLSNVGISSLTAINSDLSNAGISNLTATNLSNETADIVNAGISNLTATNSDLSNAGISNLTATNLSNETADIVNAGISNLTATNLSNETADIVNAGISNLTVINSDLSNVGISSLIAINSDLSNAGISNLTATNLSNENADIVNAGVSNLTATNSDLSNAGISNLTVSNISADKLSITLSSVTYNGISTLNDLCVDLQNQITSAQLSIDSISTLLGKEVFNDVQYFGTIPAGYNHNSLTAFLHDGLSALSAPSPLGNYHIQQGYQYRISASCNLSDNTEHIIRFGVNDYILFNTSCVLSNAAWENIDIIRDAQSEGEYLSGLVYNLSGHLSTLSGELCAASSLINLSADGISAAVTKLSTHTISSISTLSNDLSTLSTDISTISTQITSNIDYLSSELSDYHNTLSGIDRENHPSDVGHIIETDNLMLTDVTEISESGEHLRYYMTMLSGTLVLRKINN